MKFGRNCRTEKQCFEKRRKTSILLLITFTLLYFTLHISHEKLHLNYRWQGRLQGFMSYFILKFQFVSKESYEWTCHLPFSHEFLLNNTWSLFLTSALNLQRIEDLKTVVGSYTIRQAYSLYRSFPAHHCSCRASRSEFDTKICKATFTAWY